MEKDILVVLLKLLIACILITIFKIDICREIIKVFPKVRKFH